jgi:hypothetical protein
LMVDTERALYQSAGTSVQVYSQDILLDKLNAAFVTCFEAKWWPQFVTREARTLDGATGKTTAPFTSITSWEDVKSVFRRYSARPLTTMPMSFNSLDLTGTAAKYLEPSADSTLFTVYPLEAIDDIIVVGRARPVRTGAFLLADTVPFDDLALKYYAAWEYLVDDASNAGAAEKFQGLFNARMQQLQENAFDNIVPLNSSSHDIPMEWY